MRHVSYTTLLRLDCLDFHAQHQRLPFMGRHHLYIGIEGDGAADTTGPGLFGMQLGGQFTDSGDVGEH